MNIPGSGDTSLWIILLVALFLVAALLLIAFLVLRGTKKKGPASEQSLSIPQDTRVAASFHSALDVLRGRVTGGSFQYRVPWILLIGTPGSGKTSILDYLATAALPMGEGQPRDDKGIAWGFLNHGVLIDVPGSLLLGPGPGVASNESGWNQLLRRLNRHRPARPLDGVVLTIGADDLLDEKTDISVRGGLIRAKLDQLQSAIGLVLPVYVLVTRCDSIRGFGSYCREVERTDPALKKEIFGWSNNHTLESVFTWVWVDEAMNAIGRTLRRHQLGFFGAPGTLDSPDDLYLFPPDLNVLRDPLQRFLTQLFVPVSYRDAHYFRGVYFCGLASDLTAWHAGTALLAANEPSRSRLPLAFLNHLFEGKIFVEKTLARPVPQRFFFRNRIVVGAQIFAALFSLVMFTGLILEWKRLNDDKNKRILPVIASLHATLNLQTDRNGTTRAEYSGGSIDSAYEVLETLAKLHASGFSSPFFMPASRNDPVEGQIEDVLADGFQGTVLNAFQKGLEKKYIDVISNGAQEETSIEPAAVRTPGTVSAAGGEDALLKIPGMNLVPADDPKYQALQRYLTQLAVLERHIAVYDNLREPGTGNIAAVRDLLEYLSGKTLPGDARYRNNSYFEHAIGNSAWGAIGGLNGHRKAAAAQGSELIGEFYTEWFHDSSLERKVRALKEAVLSIERAGPESDSDLRTTGQAIADLDIIFSGASVDWLERPFTRQSYPALALLDDPALAAVFDQEFRDRQQTEGYAAWLGLKSQLLGESTPQSGPILESDEKNRIEISGAIRTLGSNLKYLADLDFMASANSQPSAMASQIPVFWNADLLSEALKLDASWEKYQRDVLPTIPGGMKAGIRIIAQRGLAAGMADIVARARTPIPADRNGSDPLTTELRNFDDCLDKLKQLQSIGERLGTAGTPLIASLNLYRHAILLLGGINSQLSAESLYSWQSDGMRKWDGSSPLSQVLYGSDSPEALADSVAADHERLRNLVQSANPLVQLISDGGLPVGDGRQTVYWGKLGADFKQFADKKPNNAIAALETFLQKDVDKIVPENRCQGGAADPRTGDPFVNALNGLRTDAVRACLLLVRERYNALADNFTQHLAGKFPFAADTTAPVEADPSDIANFFDLLGQNGAGLSESLDRLGALDPKIRTKAQDAVSFLKKASLVQPLFATADKNSMPALDVTVQFRSNQDRESGGNQIIDWELRIGDQVAQYQSGPRAIRWHYGDRVTLTLRYAKDSPSVPIARQQENDLQIGDRRITYDYRKNWSLLALMLRHAASATDFGNPLAPLANTVRLTFGNAPGMPGGGGAKLPDTVVFATFNLQSPAAKDAPPKDGAAKNGVVVSSFPVNAPAIP